MTREEFIEVLDREGYSYEIVGDKIVVTYDGNVFLNLLETLPPGVEFRNRSNVYLRSLETLPSDVVFKNGVDIYLDSLKTLPPGVEFKNKGWVYLKSLIGGWFQDWPGNIDGIDFKRLLNVMIKRGLFI